MNPQPSHWGGAEHRFATTQEHTRSCLNALRGPSPEPLSGRTESFQPVQPNGTHSAITGRSSPKLVGWVYQYHSVRIRSEILGAQYDEPNSGRRLTRLGLP